MEFSIPDFAPAMTEIVLALGICIVLIVDLFSSRRVTYLLSMATLVVAAWVCNDIGVDARVVTFSGSFVADPLARLLKLFSLVIVAVVFLYSRSYLEERSYYKGEYYVLGLFGLLGVMVMISAYSLLIIYLGLEMLSLSLYAMVAFDRDSPVAAEAAMKFFVLGAIASGIFLYGVSIIYGVTGSLQLTEINQALLQVGPDNIAALVGLAFILAGIAFKFGAVPFHMWLPDVYHGAPTCVTLFVGTVPKLGAFALAVRVLVDGLALLVPTWEIMLAVLAVLSLGIGNIVAIAQTNLKRMLAYSTIAHVGFIFLGLLAGTPSGLEAALFYTLVYVLMAAGAFGIIILMSRDGFEADRLDDLKGLSQRSPWFAAIMMLLMVSMIGVPPLAGFYAKWWVLEALIHAGKIWLAIAGVVFSVIGAFYYLRVIKLMYFDDCEDSSALEGGWDLRIVLSINGLAVLALGLFPDTLMTICSWVWI
jgi:NADH-quinone oxidoreductase subunit N